MTAFAATTRAPDVKATVTGFGQIDSLKNEIYQTRVLEDGSTIAVERAGRNVWISRWHANGSPDTTFGKGGAIPPAMIGGKLAGIRAIAIQGDSLIVARGGSRWSLPAYLQRYGPDGNLDRTFGKNGLVRFGQGAFEYESSLQTVETDEAGRIYIGGIVRGKVQVTRFLPSGRIDRSFGLSGSARIEAEGGTVWLRPSDAGIYVNGFRSLWRIGYDGFLDPAFTAELPRGTNMITDFEIGPGGKPLLVIDDLLIRLENDGDRDPLFGTNGVMDISLARSDIQLAVDTSQRMLLTGFRRIGGIGSAFDDSVIQRLLPDGSPDNSFDGDGELVWNFAPGERDRIIDLIVGPEDRVLVTGRTIAHPRWDEYLARVNQSGEPDETFGENGVLGFHVLVPSTDAIHALARSGRKIIAAGESGRAAGFVRYLANGRLDRTFGGDGKVKVKVTEGTVDDVVRAIISTSDGGLLACSYTYPVPTLIRLKQDGTLDPGFGSGGIKQLDGFRRCGGMRELPGDRFMVGGRDKAGAVAARIFGDGSIDSGYGHDGYARIPRSQIPEQMHWSFGADGTAWIADSRSVAKLQPDGDLAGRFGSNGILELDGKSGRPEGSWLAGMVVGRDGSIYLADRKGISRVIKLNRRGKLDTSFGGDGIAKFDPAGRRFTVNDIAVNEDGRPVLAGRVNRDPCEPRCNWKAAWVSFDPKGRPAKLRTGPSRELWLSELRSVTISKEKILLGGVAHTNLGGTDFLFLRAPLRP